MLISDCHKTETNLYTMIKSERVIETVLTVKIQIYITEAGQKFSKKKILHLFYE